MKTIVCDRVRPFESPTIRGCCQGFCEICHMTIWISPSSLKISPNRICHECFNQKYAGYDYKLGLTQNQKNELLENGMTESQIKSFIEKTGAESID